MSNNYRVRFAADPDATFEECNGEPRPLTEAEYADAHYMKDGKPVSYADYLNYYGNPNRHVYLGAILERRCVCCDTWTQIDSLWSIDLMDDNPEVDVLDKYGSASKYYALPAELDTIPGYLRDVTRELLPDDAHAPAVTDADRITQIRDILSDYDRSEHLAVSAITAFDAIRAVMSEKLVPVTGIDPRD